MLTAKEFLLLDSDATRSEVLGRFKKLVREWHPDKNLQRNATFVFKLILSAKEYAIQNSKDRIFPLLKFMGHKLTIAVPTGCECGWFFEDEFLCKSCAAPYPGVVLNEHSDYETRKNFWQVVRKISLDRKKGTGPAIDAYRAVFGTSPHLQGRILLN